MMTAIWSAASAAAGGVIEPGGVQDGPASGQGADRSRGTGELPGSARARRVSSPAAVLTSAGTGLADRGSWPSSANQAGQGRSQRPVHRTGRGRPARGVDRGGLGGADSEQCRPAALRPDAGQGLDELLLLGGEASGRPRGGDTSVPSRHPRSAGRLAARRRVPWAGTGRGSGRSTPGRLGRSARVVTPPRSRASEVH